MSQTYRRARRGSSVLYSSRRSKPRRKPSKQTIDHRLFVKPARVSEAVEHVPKHSFSDFDVHPVLARNIETKGFIKPSPIQDQTIPMALANKDVIGLANTGTGKTAAFAIPIIHKVMQGNQNKALIVAPTRELAQQIEAEFRTLTMGTRVYTATLTGGSPMWPQVKDLRRNPQIVIGTPGRIKDHIDRANLQPSTFNTVTLDEVDRMLDMGFVNDITALLNQLAADRQSLFFSATMDSKIEGLIQRYSNNPITVSVKTGNTSDSVEQDIVTYHSVSTKADKLHDILNQEHVTKALVFDETKRSVDRLARELVMKGFDADSIHGDKTQGQRKRALDRFRRNEITILVATDVAARGIDISDLTHVINYSVPQTYEDYVHRIGRAGRAGQVGYALTFVSSSI